LNRSNPLIANVNMPKVPATNANPPVLALHISCRNRAQAELVIPLYTNKQAKK
jgi:hypothetical protein